MLNSFLSTFMLVSRIKIPYHQKPDYKNFAIFLPIIGLIITFYIVFVFLITGFIIRDYILTGVLVLVFQYLAFNLFHLDGLLDTADAFLCFADREKRIKILNDSVIGVFAFFTGIVYLFLKSYLLITLIHKSGIIPFYNFTIFPNKLVSLLIIMSYPICGRMAATILPIFLKPVKKTGLGSLLIAYNPWKAAIGIFIALCLFFFFFFLVPGKFFNITLYFLFMILISAFLSFYIVFYIYKKGLGGLTGDAMGCVIETGELVYLMQVFIFSVHFPGTINKIF